MQETVPRASTSMAMTACSVTLATTSLTAGKHPAASVLSTGQHREMELSTSQSASVSSITQTVTDLAGFSTSTLRVCANLLVPKCFEESVFGNMSLYLGYRGPPDVPRTSACVQVFRCVPSVHE